MGVRALSGLLRRFSGARGCFARGRRGAAPLGAQNACFAHRAQSPFSHVPCFANRWCQAIVRARYATTCPCPFKRLSHTGSHL